MATIRRRGGPAVSALAATAGKGGLDERKSGASKPSKTGSSGTASGSGIYAGGNGLPRNYEPVSRGDQGGASRFFPVFRYEAKAGSSERPRVRKTVLRLRGDLSDDERAHVLAELRKAGVDAA